MALPHELKTLQRTAVRAGIIEYAVAFPRGLVSLGAFILMLISFLANDTLVLAVSASAMVVTGRLDIVVSAVVRGPKQRLRRAMLARFIGTEWVAGASGRSGFVSDVSEFGYAFDLCRSDGSVFREPVSGLTRKIEGVADARHAKTSEQLDAVVGKAKSDVFRFGLAACALLGVALVVETLLRNIASAEGFATALGVAGYIPPVMGWVAIGLAVRAGVAFYFGSEALGERLRHDKWRTRDGVVGTVESALLITNWVYLKHQNGDIRQYDLSDISKVAA
jgi:hypothetical protein